MKTRLCLLLSLVFAASPCLHAADLYVSEKGDDANPGTSAERPFLTLQHADSAVKPGDTVWIMAGTYRDAPSDRDGSALLEIHTSGTPGSWITWRNYKNDHPELIVQHSWQGIRFRASYIILDGLTLTGNNDNVRQIDAEKNAEIDAAKTAEQFAASQDKAKTIDESVAPDAKLSSKEINKVLPARAKPVPAYHADPRYNGNGILVDCRTGPAYHHFVVRNCTVRKFGTVGIAMIDTDYYTVENCRLYDDAWYSRYGGSGFSQLRGKNFDDAPGYHSFIRNNRCWNNKCLVRCLNTDCFSDGNGIILDSLVDYSGGILVENNVCFNNGGAGIHIFKSSKAHIDVFNNTVWRNQQMWNLYDMGCHSAVNVRFFNNIVCAERRKQVNGKPDATIIYDYNLYYGSDQIPVKGPHDLVADPKFALASTNAEVADFSVLPGSPALGSGIEPNATSNGAAQPVNRGARQEKR